MNPMHLPHYHNKTKYNKAVYIYGKYYEYLDRYPIALNVQISRSYCCIMEKLR